MKMKTLSLAIATSCMIYSHVNAAGLGKLSVLSGLGQPLRAEIELTSVTPEDAGKLVPKLADNEAYRQANVEFNPVLLTLRFALEDRGARQFVVITSPQAINDPYLEMLVELTSNSGRSVREYPVAITVEDTASTNAVADAGKVATANIVKPLSTATSATKATKPVTIPAYSPTKASADTSAPSKSKPYSYRIKPGDTLEKIARKVNYPGVSLDQMLVALQRTNAPAMIHDNMNLIRSGAILTIPDKEAVERINSSEAKQVVIAQANDFNHYRDKLANLVAHFEAEHTKRIKNDNGGKITAKVIEKPTAVNESMDKLHLSKPQVQEQTASKPLDEENIAKQKALESNNARINELKQNTEKLKQIIAMQDGSEKGNAKEDDANKPAVVPKIEAKVETNSEVLAPKEQTEQTKPVVTVIKSEPNNAEQDGLSQWKRYIPFGAALLVLIAAAGIIAKRLSKKPEQKAPSVDAKARLADIAPPVAPPVTNNVELFENELDSPDENEAPNDIVAKEVPEEVDAVEKIEEIQAQAVSEPAIEPEVAIETTEADPHDCPECEKTGTHFATINLDLDASKANSDALVQIETKDRSTDQPTEAPAPVPMEFDLSGIDLELPQKGAVSSSTFTSEEIANKLELAVAYQKIGDKEGARELLGEIIASGNQEHATRAKAMMQELNS